jgi:adenylate cyclase
VAPSRRLAAIMFTDIVGYTASAQENEAQALQSLREQERLVRPLLRNWDGRVIKSTGDGFLVEFDSALRAVQCALEILQRLDERNSNSKSEPIQLRVGIHLGDVEAHEGDIFGDAVNIASRIQPLALPGGLCISGQVYDQVRNKLPNRFEKLPPTALKHVSVPIDVYRVTSAESRQESSLATAPRTRLAVLPLSNISPDPKDEYFADGLTEEIISALSKLRELRVIARTSVSQYKATSKSVSQIGSELTVGTVLEGSVRKAGNRVRISLQLIDVGSQAHIWAENYDRQLDDVFAIQTDIAERTAQALRLELIGSERESIQKPATSSVSAYDLYLKGLHAFLQRSTGDPTAGADAIKLLEEAIRVDPKFALAHAALANVYIAFAGATLDPKEAFPRAKVLVARALELDPTSSEAHTAWGNLALQYDKDWALAERQFRMAISLNPSNASAHWWYGLLLIVLQRFPEAVEEVRASLDLDPLWEFPKNALAQISVLMEDYPAAILLLEEAVTREPENPFPHATLASAYYRAGRTEDARREAKLGDTHTSKLSEIAWALLWAWLGEPSKARAILETEPSRTEYVNVSLIAQLYVSVGENARALDLLERDVESGVSTFHFAYQSFGFDPIRSDPRFQAVLRKMNLPVDLERRPRAQALMAKNKRVEDSRRPGKRTSSK